MSSFFLQTLRARLDQCKEKYPLLKINEFLDWTPIRDYLERTKQQEQKHRNGKPAYDRLKMFKAILLGQWHGLSDPELERSLIIRADFLVFCDFDDMELPDHSTLNRYRNWLIRTDVLAALLSMINQQLEAGGLKIQAATTAVVDASIIQSRGTPKKKALIMDDEHITESPASADMDATWTRKGPHFYLGYKLHARVDEEGYFEQIHTRPAHEHESRHLQPLIVNLASGVEVLADKGYASQDNRAQLQHRGLKDGIMHKANRQQNLNAIEKQHNAYIKTRRYVVEQSFGTLKRRFDYYKAKYFTLEKVHGQNILKALCVNLLKASNKLAYAG